MTDYASRALGIGGYGPESAAELAAARRGETRRIEPGASDIPLLGRLLALRQECLGAQMNTEALDQCYEIIREAMESPAPEMQGIRLSDGEVRPMADIVALAEVGLRGAAGYVQRVPEIGGTTVIQGPYAGVTSADA